MSWNGATEVAAWRFESGPSAGRLTRRSTKPRSGFETAFDRPAARATPRRSRSTGTARRSAGRAGPHLRNRVTCRRGWGGKDCGVGPPDLGRWLAGLVALLAIPCAAPVSRAANAVGTAVRPNIVVIMTDDQTVESMRVMGNVNRLLAA